jgi:diacylglycerol kinase
MMLAIFLPVIARISVFDLRNEWLAFCSARRSVCAELVNTAIEHACSVDGAPASVTKAAKDAAAGAVLVWCVLSAEIGHHLHPVFERL